MDASGISTDANIPTGQKPHKKFWNEKLDRNIIRDTQIVRRLHDKGWKTATIWACEIKNNSALVMEKLTRLIDDRAIKILSSKG